MSTEVDLYLPTLAGTQCAYCGKMGHRASHHPDYAEWVEQWMEECRGKWKRISEQRPFRKTRREGSAPPGPVPRPPLVFECEWCGDDFERKRRASTPYRFCSRECYLEDKKEAARLRAEKQAALPAPDRKLPPPPEPPEPEGFALADLFKVAVPCGPEGGTAHPFTLAEIEEMVPSETRASPRIDDPDPEPWWVAAGPLRPRVDPPRPLKRPVVRKTPCRPPDRAPP